jgi:hypothetical protein
MRRVVALAVSGYVDGAFWKDPYAARLVRWWAGWAGLVWIATSGRSVP